MPVPQVLTVALLIPPAILLTGRMVWTRLPSTNEREGDAFEETFASLVCGVFVAGMVGLLLAECGVFRPPAFVAALGAVNVALWRLSPVPVPVSRMPRRDLCAAAVVCGLAIAAVAPASEDFLGGRDPGTYANTASWLAREGTLRMRAETLTTIPGDTRQLFYAASRRGPQVFMYGFFVAGNGETGEIIPQFLHLLPVYLAVGHWLGGVSMWLLVPPFVGVLAALAVFVFVRRMLGSLEAVIATGMLTLNLAQIWVTRTPLTEGASQLGVFVMLWCLTRAIDTAGVRWAVLAALALGTCFLLRIDALIVLAAVLPPIVLLQNQHRSIRWLTHVFLPIAVITALWGAAHGWLFSRPYVTELRTMIKALWMLTAVVLAVCVVALTQRARVASLALWIRRHNIVLFLVVATVLSGAFVFGMWVRPHLEALGLRPAGAATSYDDEALVRVAWYFSVPAMTAAFAGVLVLDHRWLVRHDVRWSPFLFVFLAFSTLYLWRQSISADHPWAMRRYAPVVVPGICVCVTAAASALWSLGRVRPLARAAALAIIAMVLWHEVGLARPFWRLSEKQGFITSLNRLAGVLPRDAIVLFNFPGRDMFVTTPLAFHLGRNVLPVVRSGASAQDREHHSDLFEAQIGRWLHQGMEVFYLTADDGNSVFTTKNVSWVPAGRAAVAIHSFGSSLRNAPRAPTTEVVPYDMGRATWVPAALEPCAPAAIRADSLLIGRSQGFLRLESRDTVRYRRLRPDARLLFASCDRGRGRPRILRIRAACGLRSTASRCDVQVTINGLAAGAIALTDDWATYDLPIPGATAAAETGPFDIKFSGPRPAQATAGFEQGRRMALQLASVALVPAPTVGRGASMSIAAELPNDLNLMSQAAQDVWGVSQSGIYGEERSGGRMFRWFERRGRLVVPMGLTRPHAERFEIWRTIRAGQPIRITANECPLFEGVPPRTEWSAVFSLETCRAAGDQLTITVEAEPMRRPGERRDLAVAVRSIRLE